MMYWCYLPICLDINHDINRLDIKLVFGISHYCSSIDVNVIDLYHAFISKTDPTSLGYSFQPQ